MIVQHNMAAVNTNRQLGISNSNLAKSTEKLSSGYRINRAGDDAAGLSISEKMRSQVRGLNKASTNAQDGISLIQTAEGALNEVHSILQRMRELAVQGANDTNVSKDRDAINSEMKQLRDEIGRIGDTTEFNTKKIMQGRTVAFTGLELINKDEMKYNLQVGANAGQVINFTMPAIGNYNNEYWGKKEDWLVIYPPGVIKPYDDVGGVVIESSVYGSKSNGDFGAVISKMDDAIEAISKSRSHLGAIQNRLEHTISNDDNTAENLQTAESRIRDVDMADEMVKYSKSSILQQAGQSMLAQANQSTQGVLSLLR